MDEVVYYRGALDRDVHWLEADTFYMVLTAHGLDMLIFWLIFFEIAILYFCASTLLRFHAGLRDHRYLNTKLRFITFESDEKNFYTYLVVRKGREELMDTLNEGLRKLQASGRYHTISQDWFAN